MSAARRLIALDTVRGLAMVFVLVSHFATFGAAPAPAGLNADLVHWLYTIGMVASPTFMLVSGLTCAMLLSSRDPARARRRILDRALFTLLVGHVYFTAVDIVFLGAWKQPLYMTDTVAIALVLGTAIVPRLGVSSRVLVGVALVVATWLVRFAWHPSTHWIVGLDEMITGPTESRVLQVEFPIVPWTGVFLLGSAMESWLSDARQSGRLTGFSRRIRHAGLAAVAAGAILKALALALRGLGIVPAESIWTPFFAAYSKYPPGPVYLLLCGGAGLALGGVMGLGLASRSTAWLPRGLAVFGRASLFTFMAQALVYIGLVRHAPWPLASAWGFWFLVSVALVWIAAWGWDAANGNRWLTFGLAVREQ